jgi:hypothetical protein
MALKFMLSFIVILVGAFIIGFGCHTEGKKRLASIVAGMCGACLGGVFISALFWIWS